MSDRPDQKSRGFSKRLTAWSLFGIYGLAFYGVSADVIAVVGSTAIAHLTLYQVVGHLDYRTVIASGLLNLTKRISPDA
ncbi:hypothetical protein ACCS79_03510 [Rhizobium johnstonii]|uniref:hypothetical protein n=1 Tax=Rhizobium johnstonii TaxID=3019933 RepID=UPI003F960171